MREIKSGKSDQILKGSVENSEERGQFNWTEGRRQAALLLRMVTCIY